MTTGQTPIGSIANERRPLRGWRAWLVWGVVAANLTFMFGVLLTAGLGPDTPAYAVLIYGAMVTSLGGIGALVATRQPRNPVGWILWATGTMVAVSVSGADYVRLSLTPFGGGLPATVLLAWLQGILFVPAAILITAILPLYFPDGTLLSRRWRWAVLVGVALLIIFALPSAFDPGPLTNTTIENPLGITGFHALDGLLSLANLLIAFGAFPLVIISSVLRYRRGTTTVRQQFKWFGAAVGLTVAGLSLSLFGGLIGSMPTSDVGWLLGMVGLALIPVAIGVAVLRYRLYDIDRIISRGIAYASVTGVLGVTFVALALLLQAVLEPFTQGQTIATAASTLAVFALLQPVLRRIRRVVDRRFDRARYDAERISTAFGDRLRVGFDPGLVATDLADTTSAILAPKSVGIWMRSRSGR